MDEKVTLYRDINSDKEDGQEPVYKRWFPKTTDECVIITDGEIAEEVTLKTRIEQLKLKIADLEKEASVLSESIGNIKNLPNKMTDIVSAVTKNAEDISQQNSNIPSITFTIRPGLRDILDPSNKSGVYETNLAVLNLPLSAYGRAIISKNQENKWIYVEFLPTDLSTIYFNFYNGYSDIPGWIGWKKIPFQSI